MVDVMGRELLELGRARNQRLRKLAEENGASEASIQKSNGCLDEAIEKLAIALDRLAESQKELESIQGADHDEDRNFLRVHGIDIDGQDVNSKENMMQPNDKAVIDGQEEPSEMKGNHLAAERARIGVGCRSNSLAKVLLDQVGSKDFSRIPPTTRARLDLNLFNEMSFSLMIVALNEAIAKKMTLLKKPIQQLRQEEREIVYAWRSQAVLQELHNKIFIEDGEFRRQLRAKQKVAWTKAGIPCLRALKMIEEVRVERSLYIVPIRKRTNVSEEDY
uniref:SKA complex subunit 1 n=1 Tax=Ascaris lumbricoides TaxID=6252 RepID=A0A0M3IFD4_ASCLU